jgi:hypothetical protein
MLILLFSCTRIHVVPPPQMVVDVKAEDTPIQPQEPPRKKAESMNTEYFLGSEAQEKESFEAFSYQIQSIQNRQSQDNNQPVQRGFHGKSHGCLEGEMRLVSDRDPRTRFGVFSDAHSTWPVWVRFSNGVGWKQEDKVLDARGMAVKLMGVSGERLTSDETQTQDFLMTNSPSPVGKNAEEFMTFADKNSKGTLATLLFALRKPRTVAPAITKTGAVDSMLALHYWSGGAYHLGAHQAVKFSSRACEPHTQKPSRKDPNYLGKDLRDGAKEELCFSFYVQIQVDPYKTPIEDAAKVWKPSVSPLLHVADIVFPAQDFSSEEQKAFCSSLSFNPWHGIPAHQPMGHINRARKYVYDASRNHRGGSVEPLLPEPESIQIDEAEMMPNEDTTTPLMNGQNAIESGD